MLNRSQCPIALANVKRPAPGWPSFNRLGFSRSGLRATNVTRTTIVQITFWLCLLVSSGCSWTGPAPGGGGGYIPVDDDGFDYSNIPPVTPRAEPQTGAGNPEKYRVFGKKYRVWSTKEARNYRQRGKASWYGEKFHGRKTSNGEVFDMLAVTAAHKNLRIPCYLQVTNLGNGRSIVVRVNDRGPFVGNRILDLSYAAAAKLGMVKQGVADVEIALIDPDNYQPPAYQPQANRYPAAADVDFGSIPTAKTYPVNAPAVAPVPVPTAPRRPTSPGYGGVDLSSPANASETAYEIQPYDGGEYRVTGTAPNVAKPAISAGSGSGNNSGATEDFTSVYIQESDIAEYERLNPLDAGTAPLGDRSAVNEVEFIGGRPAMAVPDSIDEIRRSNQTVPAPPIAPQPAITPLQSEPLATALAAAAYYVQIATFGEPDNAIALARKLAQQNFSPVRLVPRLVPGNVAGKTLQQVRMGPFSDARDAKIQQQALTEAGYFGSFIVRSRE